MNLSTRHPELNVSDLRHLMIACTISAIFSTLFIMLLYPSEPVSAVVCSFASFVVFIILACAYIQKLRLHISWVRRQQVTAPTPTVQDFCETLRTFLSDPSNKNAEERPSLPVAELFNALFVRHALDSKSYINLIEHDGKFLANVFIEYEDSDLNKRSMAYVEIPQADLIRALLDTQTSIQRKYGYSK